MKTNGNIWKLAETIDVIGGNLMRIVPNMAHRISQDLKRHWSGLGTGGPSSSLVLNRSSRLWPWQRRIRDTGMEWQNMRWSPEGSKACVGRSPTTNTFPDFGTWKY